MLLHSLHSCIFPVLNAPFDEAAEKLQEESGTDPAEDQGYIWCHGLDLLEQKGSDWFVLGHRSICTWCIIEIHRYLSTFCSFYFCQICTAKPLFKLLMLGRKGSSNLSVWDIEVESTCYGGNKEAKWRWYGGTERLHTGHSETDSDFHCFFFAIHWGWSSTESKSRGNSGPLYGARGSKIDVTMQALPLCCLVTYCYVWRCG